MRALVSSVVVVFALLPLGPAISAGEPASHFFSLNTGDLRSELADARDEGKRALLLFFEQEGCPGRLYMKQNVLNRSEVQAYYRKHFVNLALDIHGSVAIRDFAGRELTEKDYAQALKIRATPTFVFIDPAGAEIVRFVGPLQTTEEFLLLGEFVATGAYKTRSFARYKREKLTAPSKKVSTPIPSPTSPLPRPVLAKGEGRFVVQCIDTHLHQLHKGS